MEQTGILALSGRPTIESTHVPAHSPALVPPGAPPDPRATWLPWTRGSRANTTIDEVAFMMRLSELADRRRESHRRSDITALVNALRSGLSVDELLDRAPGLVIERLYSAYLTIDELRYRSAMAWTTIVSEPGTDVVRAHGAEAGKLVPALISHLHAVIDQTPERLPTVVSGMAAAVKATNSCVRALESEIAKSVRDAERSERLQRMLYEPGGSGATSRPEFLPGRVGTLVPQAVAALLGERVDITTPHPSGRPDR